MTVIVVYTTNTEGKVNLQKREQKGQFNSVKYNNVINDYKQVCNTLIVIC